jgi:hypothetical protein
MGRVEGEGDRITSHSDISIPLSSMPEKERERETEKERYRDRKDIYIYIEREREREKDKMDYIRVGNTFNRAPCCPLIKICTKKTQSGSNLLLDAKIKHLFGITLVKPIYHPKQTDPSVVFFLPSTQQSRAKRDHHPQSHAIAPPPTDESNPPQTYFAQISPPRIQSI